MKRYLPHVIVTGITCAGLAIGADNVGPSEPATVIVITGITAIVALTIVMAAADVNVFRSQEQLAATEERAERYRDELERDRIRREREWAEARIRRVEQRAREARLQEQKAWPERDEEAKR